MKILNKVTKDGSPYAFSWTEPNGKTGLIRKDMVAEFENLGFIKGRLLLVDIETIERRNPETSESVGLRITGFTGNTANSLATIAAQKELALATANEALPMLK